MGNNKTHDLKCVSDVFKDKWAGLKPWEFRLNDRDYKVGDLIREQEYKPENKYFTGNEILEEVKYIVHGGVFGIPDGYCIMTTVEIHRVGRLKK